MTDYDALAGHCFSFSLEIDLENIYSVVKLKSGYRKNTKSLKQVIMVPLGLTPTCE